MAFNQRINSEVIYYRIAFSAFKTAYMEMHNWHFSLNYGTDCETEYNKILPHSEKGILNAYTAIINWACCIESCVNLIIFQNFDTIKNFSSKHEARSYNDIAITSITKKLKLLTKWESKVFNHSLYSKLTELFRARNELVHYDAPIVFCGGNTEPENFGLLEKKKLTNHFKTVNQFLDQAIKQRILRIDPRNPNAPIFGDGDIEFYANALPRHKQLLYVIKHPIWYLFKRLPKKRAYNKRKQNLKKELELLTCQDSRKPAQNKTHKQKTDN